MLDRITPVILTRDEDANIGRTLPSLHWAREIVVVDSFSTDSTVDIAKSFGNVRLLQREFDSLAGQSNFGLAEVRTEWAMLLDADYTIPPELVEEMRSLRPHSETAAYRASFVYAINGRRLRGSLYPPRIVLLRTARGRVIQDGHAHRVVADGRTDDLRNVIIHDDRKSFERFLSRQRMYMQQEARKIRTTRWNELPPSGKVRKLVFVAPWAAAFHSLIVRRLILDGTAGLRYSFERFVAELILSRELLRRSRSTP